MGEIDVKIAETEDKIQAKTDEFQAREQVIETLTDVLGRQRRQPVYVEPEPIAKPPNYLLYAAIGIGLWLFLRK